MRKRQTGGAPSRKTQVVVIQVCKLGSEIKMIIDRMEYIGISVELKAKKFEQSRQR